ncbi:MAG: hypothetical protein QXP91_09525 [Candidatus Methanomethylicia archaeon]
MEVLFEIAVVFMLFTIMFSVGLLEVCSRVITASNLVCTGRLAYIADLEAERIAKQIPPQLKVAINSSIILYERVEKYQYALNKYSMLGFWETEKTRYLLVSNILRAESVKLIYVDNFIVRIYVVAFWGGL